MKVSDIRVARRTATMGETMRRSDEDLVQQIALRLEAGAAELARAMVERIQHEVPQLVEIDRPEIREAIFDSCISNVQTGFAALGRGIPVPQAAPPGALGLARTVVRARIPLPALLSGYRVGQQFALEAWNEAVEELHLDEQARQRLARRGSLVIFRFIDEVATKVTEEYLRERDALTRDREHRRSRLVERILAGHSVDSGELGYDLYGVHLGVVAWGGRAEAALRLMAAELDRQLLTVAAGEDTIWAWLGGGEEFGAAADRTLARIDRPDGVSLAVGAPASGIEGFRLTHRQARGAQRIALLRQQPVTRYRDVALEVVLMADESQAREFAAHELHELAGNHPRSRQLRETLEAYFRCEQNASSAAAALGVHQQTVTNRLRAIEVQLGYPPSIRRAELEAGLRIEALLAERPEREGRPF
jgi:DNA-binding PucR family transcriptional regulator